MDEREVAELERSDVRTRGSEPCPWLLRAQVNDWRDSRPAPNQCQGRRAPVLAPDTAPLPGERTRVASVVARRLATDSPRISAGTSSAACAAARRPAAACGPRAPR